MTSRRFISPSQGSDLFLQLIPGGVAPGYYISRLQREHDYALADGRATARTTAPIYSTQNGLLKGIERAP